MLVSRLLEHDKTYFSLASSLAPIAFIRELPLDPCLALGFDPTVPAISILRAYDIHHCLQSTFLVRNACFSWDRPAMEGNQDTEILGCQRISCSEFTSVLLLSLALTY